MSEMTLTLQHQLNPHFEELSRVEGSKALEQHPLYQKLYPEIQKILSGYEVGYFAETAAKKPFYRAVTWNVERGIEFTGIVDTLRNHPILKEADLLLIPETDLGMARSGNRNVAQELAAKLKLNYYFVPTYINLSKGNGHEVQLDGENTLAIHGNAILSRYPIEDFHRIPLHNNKDKMKGKEKRLGYQQALACTTVLPQGKVRLICAHLDAHSSKRHRYDQMQTILRYVDRLPALPSLFGGDLNTTTYNSRHAAFAIFGFWVRVAMGVRYVMSKHYPYPDRFFEKFLFKSFEKFGFDYQNWNEPGASTLHYHVEDIKQFKNLRDIIPEWCFKFIEWALKEQGGKCSFKIDWFAAKDLKLVRAEEKFPGHSISSINPRVVGNLEFQGRKPSDHDAIVVDFKI